MTDPEKTETTPVVEEKAISPKDLVKVERPNKAKLLEECKVLEDQRNIVEAKIVAVKREIESFAAQEQEMDKIQREKEQVRNEVNALRKQREAIEGAMNKFNADRKQTRSQIRFTNVADIDREIKKLEDKQIRKAGLKFLNPNEAGTFLNRPTAPPQLKTSSGQLFKK